MAKLALTLTLFIAVFIVAGAEHPLDLFDDELFPIRDPSITRPEPEPEPEPESKMTILLPSETPESEPATLVKLEHDEKEKDTIDTESEEMEEEVVQPRDGDERRVFVPRHPHHRCHHPHRRPHHHPIFFHQFDGERRERSYGNDMLVADPEKGLGQRDFSYGDDMLVAEPETKKGLGWKEVSFGNDMLVADPESEKQFGAGALTEDLTEVHMGHAGGHRHAPSRWLGLHFGGRPRFPIDPDHEHGPQHQHHHHHHHDLEEDEEHRREENHQVDENRHEHRHGMREEGGGGLVKRIRKFLHQIDF